MQFTKGDDTDDVLFHCHATRIFVLSYLRKISIAGRGVGARLSVFLSYDVSLADQKDYGELFGCMPSRGWVF